MNVYYCVLFSSKVRVRIRVRIRFTVWFVSCYAHATRILSYFRLSFAHYRVNVNVTTECVLSNDWRSFAKLQIAVSSCVAVEALDRVGFTTFEGATPFAARFDADLYALETTVRVAPASGPFRALTLPYDFAVAAAYQPDATC